MISILLSKKNAKVVDKEVHHNSIYVFQKVYVSIYRKKFSMKSTKLLIGGHLRQSDGGAREEY